MSNYYTAIIHATRHSANAIQTIVRLSHQIRSYERAGDTAGAAPLYVKLCAAQRRYARAQEVLARHPLPGDR